MSISVENLWKRFGNTAVVHGISFDIADGEFVSILGPSGCGKTTTLRCIAGLEEASGGTIRIGGETVMSSEAGILVPPHERHVGMVFQSYAVWPHMSVAENVAFPLRARKWPKAEIAREVETALDVVALGPLRDRQPSQLSGGQQQRVALARAIVGRPRVLLFDEPLSNLDAKLREETRGEIRRLQRRLGTAALYVTHDQDEALSMSDRVIVMEAGEVRQSGTPRDLYRRPANRFVAGFVGRGSIVEAISQAEGWATPAGAAVQLAETGSGERRFFMIRPEDLAVAPADEEGGLPEANRLAGRIAATHYLGAYSEYHVEAQGWLLKVHSRRDIPADTPVVVGFSPEAAKPLD